jgi:osmotically-inducible protein OsmY
MPLLLAAGLAFAGCKDAGDRPTTGAPGTEKTASGPGTDGVKMSDADLEKAIKAKLETDAQIREANLSVNAEANENKVSIKGTVPSQEVRTKAIDLAKSVQPNLTINDEIEVKPAG